MASKFLHPIQFPLLLYIKTCITALVHVVTSKNGYEDYDCWLRALEHTDSVYVKDICFYYDIGHGDGKNY